jgi:hypothetical protein
MRRRMPDGWQGCLLLAVAGVAFCGLGVWQALRPDWVARMNMRTHPWSKWIYADHRRNAQVGGWAASAAGAPLRDHRHRPAGARPALAPDAPRLALMSDPNRRTMGPEEPTGRGLRLGLLITGLVLVVAAVILITAVPGATTPGVVVGAIGIVIVIAGPIFGRRRPPTA